MRKLSRRTDLKDNRRALHGLLPWLSLLLLFGFASRETAEAADVANRPVASVGPGLQFAIEDFDGDLRPDLASIQVGQGDFSHTDYWIQLQLSAGGRQSIRVIGPAGGLTIEARDVNGDHAIDLIVGTAWFRQPVAIFLNDGHGRFSRAEPTEFPGSFSESKTNWGSALYQAIGALGAPPQSCVGLYSKARALPQSQRGADSIAVPSAGYPLSSFLVSHAGRAPPSEVLHVQSLGSSIC